MLSCAVFPRVLHYASVFGGLPVQCGTCSWKYQHKTNNCWSLKETCLKLNIVPRGFAIQANGATCYNFLSAPPVQAPSVSTSAPWQLRLSNFNINHGLLSLLPINHRTLVTSRYSGLCLSKRIQIFGKIHWVESVECEKQSFWRWQACPATKLERLRLWEAETLKLQCSNVMSIFMRSDDYTSIYYFNTQCSQNEGHI